MKKYHVFDNVYDYTSREHIERYFLNFSNYKLGWNDIDTRPDLRYIHADLTRQHIQEDLSLISGIKNQELIDKIGPRYPTVAVINASFPGYFYYPHTHKDLDAFVYYVNMDWRSEWAGETIVYDDDGTTINGCIPYSPGKVLWIENGMPHTLRPPTFNAPFYRFTVSLFFKK